MIKINAKLITLLLIFNIDLLHSADYNIYYNNLQDNQLDNSNIHKFDNIYNSLNTVNNNINDFISLVFKIDKLDAIMKSNNINVLNNINNTLNIDCVKHYIIENGIESKSIDVQVDQYTKIFTESDLEFSYDPKKLQEENEDNFRIIYNDRFTKLFYNIDEKINIIGQKAEILKRNYQDLQNNSINNIKLSILNKVIDYLLQNKTHNTNLLDKIQNNWEVVFYKIINKPIHELLDINENFFSDINNKIKNTHDNEQLQNIYEFVKVLIRGLPTILQRNNNDLLLVINSTLDLHDIEKYFSKDCFLFENSKHFEKEIKKQDKTITFNDFKKFEQFIKEKLPVYIDICDYWNTFFVRSQNKIHNMLSINIKNKLEKYFNDLKEYCYSKIDIDNQELENYFIDRFIMSK